MKKSIFINLFLFFTVALVSQTYPPPVGINGTTAIYKDSSVFVSWVSKAKVLRGFQDISNPSFGFASAGDSSMLIGPAQVTAAVSLGDGGSAICEFPFSITNGSGFDFAVFENSFDDTFLELAFVEVSSDGVNFFRFPSHSLSDTVNQTTGFGPTNTIKINNLAGKYRGGYGTPFDLQELSHIQGLNVNAVTHVKIIDVVGSLLKAYATYDSFNNKINDPWPTPFPSSGFDLDAIGVIHENKIVGIKKEKNDNSISIFPNPLASGETLHLISNTKIEAYELSTLEGVSILTGNAVDEIETKRLANGIYFLKVVTTDGYFLRKIAIY